MTALAKQIDQISKLRVRTVDRAATQAEEETAATVIGRILMRNPQLDVTDGAQSSQPDPEGLVIVGRDAAKPSAVLRICETSKAVLVFLPSLCRDEWIPKSQIRSADWAAGEIVVSRWIWERKGGAAS